MSKQKPPRTPPPTARAAPKPTNAAGRTAAKPSARPPAIRPDAAKALETAVERLEESVAELKRERDDLTARLEAAQSEIAALDSARKAAIDRIDWVIDSLHTVLQDKS